MRQIDSSLQSHLGQTSTELCYCWKVELQDSTVLGFTDHDSDISFESTTFSSSSGFMPTTLSQKEGLSVDNIDVEGAFKSVLSSSDISEEDLLNGRYDDAVVTIFLVRWSNVSQRLIIFKGKFGGVRFSEGSFSVEMDSLSINMTKKIGRTFTRTCSADLGDSKCKVNLTSHRAVGAVTSVSSNHSFSVSISSGPTADDYFSLGKIEFTSGPLSGKTFRVRRNLSGVVHLFRDTFQPPIVGNSFLITAGCGKDIDTCRSKFSNVVNFRGFNLVPGNDVITRYPDRNSSDNTGESLVR